MELKRGQVWSVEFLDKKRKRAVALIISSAQLSRIDHSPIVVEVTRLSTKDIDAPMTVALSKGDSAFEYDMLVRCDTIATLPFEYFTDYIGTLNSTDMKRVENVVKNVLGIKE